MDEVFYTLGVWRVKPGQEKAFIAAWKALGEAFRHLMRPPADKGILLQSLTDPSLYYSFGPWRSLEDIQAMRADPRAQEGIRKIGGLCTEATPGAFRVVAEAPAKP